MSSERPDYELFDRFPADPEVIRTRPRLYMVAASVIVLGHNRKPASTAITDEKAGEEVRGRGPAACEQPLSGLQSTLDGVPNLVVNDPQRVDHARLPLVSRSPPVDASPGLGMLSPFSAIEVEPKSPSSGGASPGCS